MSMNPSQIRGLVVVVLLVGGLVALWLLRPGTADGVLCEAWFEGAAAVENSTPIMFQKTKIGAVDSVAHEQVALQLVIARDGLPARSQTVTLQSGETIQIPEANLTLQFHQDSLQVSTPRGAIATIKQATTTPGKETRWLVMADAAAMDGMMLEDKPLRELPNELAGGDQTGPPSPLKRGSKKEMEEAVDSTLQGEGSGVGGLRQPSRTPSPLKRGSKKEMEEAVDSTLQGEVPGVGGLGQPSRPPSPLKRGSKKEKVGIRINDGERLRVGAITIQWNPPAVFTRIFAKIDTAILAESLGGRSGFGPGAGLRLSSNFGLTQPTLTLEPSFATSPIATRAAGANPELSVRGGFDFEAVANQLTDYAFSRSRINAPPTNRYQRVIFDLNNTLANIDSITADLNTFAATPEGVKTPPKTRFDFIVHNIQNASDDLDGAVKAMNRAALDIDATVLDVKGTTLPEINQAVREAQAMIERLQITAFELQQVSQRIRTGTLPHLEGDVDEINADVTRTTKSIQEATQTLNRLIEDIRRKLP